jgi:potassium-transporting ATPase ATP-binding subunit
MEKTKAIDENKSDPGNTHEAKTPQKITGKVLLDSIMKMSPLCLAKNSPVMFTVEVGFFVVLAAAIFPNLSHDYINMNPIFYAEVAAILIITVWFATFSESLSEAQAKARVDSLRNLEKEVSARKLTGAGSGSDTKETIVSSTSLKPGDEVRVYAGEIIPRDGLVQAGKAFVDESMMTGESNPVYKEKGDHVIGGTRVASDSMIVEITAEAGRSFLDQMTGLIENATRPKTQNEIALTILLAGLSIIFVTVIGTLLFFTHFLGYKADIAVLLALLVALMPTTIGGLLPAIGVAGITRLGKDNIVAKSGKGIEAAGDCDVLVLDKTGTITEGSRTAVEFTPMQGFSEQDIGQAAYVSSYHDTTHEGKSIIDLAEQKGFVPPLLERVITAKPIEFSAETRFSGVDFVQDRRVALSTEQSETLASLEKQGNGDGAGGIKTSECRVSKILSDLVASNKPVRVLKGSIDAILPLVDKNVNEAEMRWKSQEISKSGGTPLAVAINDQAIGVISLKDNLKENIKAKLDEVRAAGITTVMVTGDNQITAQVIAKEAGLDQVMADAKPTDKLKRVVEEQARGHIIGMVGDGTNDAPALAKADIGLAMNSGTSAAKEAANMVDLDSDPSKILKVVKLGKQLLMTRGAITTFSIANDAAKYFAILPAMFMQDNPKMQALNVMQLHSPETAILSTLIFNAIIIPLLIPLSLRGIKFKPEPPQKTFLRNMIIYGIGGAILPFVAIKGIDLLLSVFMR